MYPNPSPRGIAWPSTAVIAWMRERVAAAGCDPSVIPDEPVRFWRVKEVMARTGLKRTTLWRRMKSGEFPTAVTLRAVGDEMKS